MTWAIYGYGLACAVSGWLFGLLTPRLWRFMTTTFAWGA